MGKKGQDEKKRQRKAEKRKAKRDEKKQRTGPRTAGPVMDTHAQWTLSSDFTRCHPPVFFDGSGNRADDPRALLGLGAGPLTEAEIRDAWRKKLIEHPPEQDPEGARRLREARDRLLDPERVLERLLGELYVPDRAAYGLSDQAIAQVDRGDLDAMARLAGQALLYTLVEDALLEDPPPPKAGKSSQLALL